VTKADYIFYGEANLPQVGVEFNADRIWLWRAGNCRRLSI